MVQNKPKVCVVIYCHNNTDTIGRALNSVFSQSYAHKEIIIVDDASTDNSWEIICGLIGCADNKEDFIATNILDGIAISGIRHEYETGLPGVFLTGANATWDELDIIGLLKATDEYLPDKLSKSVEYMKDIDELVGVLYSDYKTLIDGEAITMYRQSFSRDRLNFGDCVLITKTAVQTIGMVNPDKGDEALIDLCLRITGRFAAIHIPEILSQEFGE